MKIITISREYGAGGHSIGTKVAERLGIEFYDRDIISETAKASGISTEQIEKEEEKLSRTESFLRAITPIPYSYKDNIFEYQRRVLTELAQKGPCVVLGRCADVFLPEAGLDCLNVFLYADTAHRIKRVGEMIGSDNENEILRAIKKTDIARHAYYEYYTGKTWGDCHNYRLVLDSGALGNELCIELICRAAE